MTNTNTDARGVLAEFVAPSVPNFITLKLPSGEEVKMGVGLLGDEQIAEVIDMWATAFRKNCAEKARVLGMLNRD